MDWAELTIVFFICHLVGDFLLQTDWQATHKGGGLGRDPVARRALFTHVGVYTLSFVPALVWIGDEQGAAVAVGIGALIAIPHLVIDDMRLLNRYMVKVKRCADPPPVGLTVSVDQSFHLICLWATALLAAA
jgi:Protein of unknown function (DUF3307)